MGCGEGHATAVHGDVVEHGCCGVDLGERDPGGEEMDSAADSFGETEGYGEGVGCAERMSEDAEMVY